MLATIRHQDTGSLVVVAKCLTKYLKTDKKISDSDSYIKVNGTYDADFVAYVISWQGNHGLTADGVIGPDTWAAIAKAAPTCSTAKNRISGYTFALQLLLGGNLTADAIYGARTKAAVATYQDSNRLVSDGICGAKTWNSIIVGADIQPEPMPQPGFIQPVDYKQGAKPWGPKMYSNHNDKNQTMANSGCGPTSAADVVATLKDPSVTPWTLAQLSMEWGDRTYNSGTAWSFFKHVADYYKFAKFVQTSNLDALKACLNAGGYVVCSMGPGYWTKGGHFICAWKYDSTYVYCNDPASSTRKKQKISEFMKERKQFFCFYPDPKLSRNDDEDTVNDVQELCGACMIRGEKIVDISKYQSSVNYVDLILDTALIILRAGVRKDSGSIVIDECFAKHANALQSYGIRFGVYFYSQAQNKAQAQEEARLFWQYAKEYQPLFWAMDAEKDKITNGAIVAFVEELRRLGAKKVGCYIAHHLHQKYDYASIRDEMDFTWIPRYSTKRPDYPCDLWQYSSTERVDGIAGNVDMNRVTGDGHDIEWFMGY